MRRKVALTAAAVAMVGTLAVGGTLAWFTDTETATNVVTTGNVDILLKEDGGQDGTVTEDGLEYEDVMPGDTFAKVVSIENKGNDAWVRATITVEGVDMTGEEPIEFWKDEGRVELNWTENDDNIYSASISITDALTSKNMSYEIFDQIKIPTSWKNVWEHKAFNVKVTAEAIQKENNETNPFADWENTDMGLKESDENTLELNGVNESVDDSDVEEEI